MKKILSLILVVVLSFSSAAISIDASASSYNVGDIIEFGSYPQSLVADADLIETLNSQTLNWISYGYYSGEGKHGTMVKSDYMKYADVTYGGEMYRAVTFSQYRPRISYFSGNADNSVQDTFGYTTNSVYWFKYETLEWVVLNPSSGLIICKDVIDSQPFCNTVYLTNSIYYSNNPNSLYINNYAYSSIRKWLNNDFYNTAFSSTQKNSVIATTLDNSCYDSTYSQFDAPSTTDNVFLLSYADYHNSYYGFEDDPNKNDAMRMGFATDYSKCQGLTVANSSNGFANNAWTVWLRTPGKHSRYVCASVVRGNLSGTSQDAYHTDVGVKPAMCITLPSKATYTVSYNANGGSGAPASQTKNHGVNLTLSSTAPSKKHTITYNANGGSVSPSTKILDCKFVKWNTAANGSGTSYNAGATYSANSNVTLYAQYATPTAGTLATPTRSGYKFDGWYTAASGGTKITTSTVISKNTTIYAHWTKNATTPSVTLSSISVKTNPTKTTYNVGESFNSSGLTLTAKYSDGTSKTITSGFTCSKPDMTTAGTKTVTVTYGGKTTSFNITVKAVEVKVTSVEIVVIEAFNGTNKAKVGAQINPSNASYKSITWTSSDTSVATIDSEGNITTYSVVGTSIVTVTVTNNDGTTVTDTIEVNVNGSDDSSSDGIFDLFLAFLELLFLPFTFLFNLLFGWL